MNAIDNITAAIWQVITIIAVGGGTVIGGVIGYRTLRHRESPLAPICGVLIGCLIGGGIVMLVLLFIH